MAEYVVVGVPAETFYKTVYIDHKVTKYNPDTGQPYETTIRKAEHFWLGEKTDKTLNQIQHYSWKGPKVNLSYYCQYSSGIFGEQVTSCYGENSDSEIDMNKLKEARKRVKETLKELGIQASIKAYLVTQSSDY
jgi:hypothetical protein